LGILYFLGKVTVMERKLMKLFYTSRKKELESKGGRSFRLKINEETALSGLEELEESRTLSMPPLKQ